MAKQIITLDGNIFEETPRYRLGLGYPSFKGYWQYTSDRLTKENLTTVKIRGNWFAIKYILHLDMYLIRKLKLVKYNPVLDIKYEWKYRKELQKWCKSHKIT